MAFDPDKYLAQQAGSFDPDAYLGAKKPQNQFAENAGGAAFGRPNVRGQVNIQETPRPLESFLAGVTKSAVVDPVLGTAQLLSGGNVGTEAAKRYQEQFAPYKEENPISAIGGQITGAILPAGATGSAIGKLPSMEKAMASVVNAVPNALQRYAKVAVPGAGYGAISSVFTPDVQGETPQEVTQNRISNVLRDTAIGAAIPSSFQAVRDASGPIKRAIGLGGSELLGYTTGTSGDVIREAYKAGKEGSEQFVENMRGQVPTSEVLNAAQSALGAMRQARKEAFKEGFESTKANQTFLDFKPVEDKFKEIIDSYKVTGVGGVQVSSVGKQTMQTADEVKKLINEWKRKPEIHTAEGLDALKRRIDDLWSDSLPKNAQAIITQTRNAVKNIISKQDKNYDKTMRGYEEALDAERQIEKALSLRDDASIDTALRKLQSVTRNNANTNYGYRQELLKQMKDETGVDLMPALSGQALNTWTPRGMNKLLPALTTGVGIGNPLVFATLPTQSPRAMGEVLYKMGQRAAKNGQSVPMSDERRKLAELLLQQSLIKNEE